MKQVMILASLFLASLVLTIELRLHQIPYSDLVMTAYTLIFFAVWAMIDFKAMRRKQGDSNSY